MSEHREEHLELCAGYALGSLDPADRARLEAHLDSGCPECRRALSDFSDASVLLGASAQAAAVPAGLKTRVLAAVEAEPGGVRDSGPARVIPLRPRRAPLWGVALPLAAAAALAVTSVLLWNQVRSLETTLGSQRRDLADLNSRLAEAKRLVNVLSAPSARVAVLEMTPAGQQALRARATYDPASRTAVVIFENFKAPAGHDYELWAIRGAAPVSLGIIQTDDQGRAILRLENVGEPDTLNAFAVSLEPAGGSPSKTAPSGPVVMLGKLGG